MERIFTKSNKAEIVIRRFPFIGSLNIKSSLNKMSQLGKVLYMCSKIIKCTYVCIYVVKTSEKENVYFPYDRPTNKF